MNPSYKRDKEHNYMILEAVGTPNGSEYQIRMLLLNSMKHILPCKMRKIDGVAGFYYDITGKQPISRVFEKKLMGQKDIENLLLGFEKAMDEAKRYLLDVEQFLTGPDYIYLDQETGEAYFCYLPFYDGNLGEDFRKVTEYILKRLDHSEEAAVLLGYDIYSQSLDGDFSIGRLLKNVRKRGAGRETDHPKDTEADTGTERGFSDNHSAWETEEPEIAEEEEPPEKMNSGEDACQQSVSKQRKLSDRAEETDRSVHNEFRGAYGDRQSSFCKVTGEESNKNRKNGRKMSGGDSRKNGKKGSRRGNRRNANRNKEKQEKTSQKREYPFFQKKTLCLCGGILGILAVSYGAMLIGDLNLTQTGGILFLMGSLFIYFTSVFKRKPKEVKTKIPEFLEDLEEKEWDQEVWEQKDQGEETVLLWDDTQSGFPVLVSMAPDKRENIVLDKDSMVIGKAAGQADIVIDLSVISRAHARIEKREKDYYVTDLDSRNGTFLDGQRLEPGEAYKLSDGMNIAFSTALYYIKLL